MLLGLVPLCFVLAEMTDRFVCLKTGLAVLLVVIGAEFICSRLFGKLPIAGSRAPS